MTMMTKQEFYRRLDNPLKCNGEWWCAYRIQPLWEGRCRAYFTAFNDEETRNGWRLECDTIEEAKAALYQQYKRTWRYDGTFTIYDWAVDEDILNSMEEMVRAVAEDAGDGGDIQEALEEIDEVRRNIGVIYTPPPAANVA